jgi:xylose isomerase
VVTSADAPWNQQEAEAKQMRQRLDERGLVAEFIAPRLWEHPLTIDGAITANSAETRKYALERSKRAVDIARIMGTKDLVLWPAREGTYLREAKDPVASVARLVEWMNALLEHDKDPHPRRDEPNEPMDYALCRRRTLPGPADGDPGRGQR